MKNIDVLGVAIPTYNRPKMLRELLNSIETDTSVFISDNGGVLGNQFYENRLKVVVRKTTPVIGMFENWNVAGFMADSEWMLLPSDDDIYYPDSFEKIMSAIEQFGETSDMIVFGHHTINEKGDILQTYKPNTSFFQAPHGFEVFKYGVDARMPSILIRTELFKRLNGFDEKFKLTAADSDFLQRASLVGNVQFFSEVVSGYRVWDGGATSQTLATLDWMNEIDMWCNHISEFCDEQGIKGIYNQAIHDEIYAQNLVAGISVAKKAKGVKAAMKHLSSCRFPMQARVKTKLKILYKLFR